MIQSEQEYLRVYGVWRKYTITAEDSYDEREVVQSRGFTDDLKRLLTEYDDRVHPGRDDCWMPTFTQRRFWLYDPRPGDLDIRDIARGLSRISRFNGATRGGGYTVAQHSVVGSCHIASKYALAFLLHDAPEAYYGDIISPLKEILAASSDTFTTMESKAMAAIAQRWGLVLDEEASKAVKHIDLRMLVTEGRDLVPVGYIRGRHRHQPLSQMLVPWDQDRAERKFLERFAELCPQEAR
jgi:hypothetical protein